MNAGSPDRKTREDCIRLLVRTLHHDVVENIQRTIAKAEGTAPETRHLPELMAGRDWLFGEYDYYVDTSHLISVVKFSLDLQDLESLRLAEELTEYGARLRGGYEERAEPPFVQRCRPPLGGGKTISRQCRQRNSSVRDWNWRRRRSEPRKVRDNVFSCACPGETACAEKERQTSMPSCVSA